MQNVQALRRKRGSEPEPTDPHDGAAPPRPAAATLAPATLAPATLATVEQSATPGAAIARVDGVHLGPLARMALRCALVATTVGATGITLLWILASATGAVGRTESFMESIGYRDFHVSGTRVVVGTVVVIAGLALVLASFVVVMGAGYNLFALRGKGLRVRVAVLATEPARATAESASPSATPVGAPATAGGFDPAA